MSGIDMEYIPVCGNVKIEIHINGETLCAFLAPS